MKTKIFIALLLLSTSVMMAQKTVEKRTWKGTGFSGAYVMKNGELIPVDQIDTIQPAAENKETVTSVREETTTVVKSETPMVIADVPVDNRPGSYRMAKEFYGWAGKNFLSFVSGGYTYDFFDGTHIVDMSILDWRTHCFGMSLFNAELQISPFEKRAVYKPTINFYIPCCKFLAVKLYTGPEADMSYIYKAKRDYEYDYDNDFFLNIDAGIGFQFVPYGIVPVEILAEYRYPIDVHNDKVNLPHRDFMNQGFYLTGRIYLGMPFGRSHK